MNFLADMDLLISRQTDAEAINDLNSIATWYTNLVKRQPMDRVLRKTSVPQDKRFEGSTF